MAKYFLYVKIFSRARGSRVTKAAAYRAGERIHDERTSESYNYSNRQDVVAKEIVLPSRLAGRTDMNWARNRSALWNAAEHSDRRNARLAREVLVILPPELTAVQRTLLVRRFSQELSDKYQNAVDFTVHEPRQGSDERHHHAHLLMTTRQVTSEGLGARTTLELGGTARHARGLGPSKEDLLLIRERWAQVNNEALRDAGLTTRIDHRSYKDQGIDREPQPMMPQRIYYQERISGLSSPAGNDIRARYRERVEARVKGSAELARVMEKQNAEGRRRAIRRAEQKASLPKKIPRGALTRKELKQKRREYVSAHRAEINRKKRESYKSRAARATAQRLSVQGNPLEKTKVEALHTTRNAVSLKDPSPTASAEESVKKWLAFRESGKQIPAEQPLNQWLAHRDNQNPAGSTRTASEDRSRDPDENKDRRRRNDLGL